jgi:RNA polymerase sigma-70 factor (ECF subfamily)
MNLTDQNTFAKVYDAHRASVERTAYRVLGNAAQAQDVTQDVFLRVWRNPRKFDAQRGELGSYLRLMARSRAVDLWRESGAAARAGDRLQILSTRAEAGQDERPEARAERSDDAGTLRSALGVLPHAQREAVVLAFWGGLTAEEIARRCGVPLGTAKSRIRLGLAKMRSELVPAATAAAA